MNSKIIKQGNIKTYRFFTAAFLVIFLVAAGIYPLEKTGWTQYRSNQFTRCIASRGDYCWIGNYGDGLYKLDIASGDLIHFTNLNSGLPSNLVNDIISGQDSTVWIATSEGLASFDGRSWHIFNRENAPFTCNNICALGIDDQGNLWVSSVSGFYCCRNAQWIDILEKYPGFPLEMLWGATKIYCIGSEVWLQFSNYSVCLKNGTWERLSELSGLCISSDGTRWYLSARDKTLIGIRGDTIESIPVPMSYLSGTLFIDSSDTKWIFRNDTLYCKKTEKWSVVTIPQTFRNGSNFSFLRADNAQFIWFVATNALLRYSPDLDEWKSYPMVVNSGDSYSNISKIAVDVNHILWASNSNGLHYYFVNTWTQSDLYNQFSGAYPRAFEVDNTGKVHVASWQGNSELILYAAVKKDHSPGGLWSVTQCSTEANSCVMACYDPAANAWIYNTNSYTRGFGLKMVIDGKCQSLPYPDDSTRSLSAISVTDNGTVWALTRNNTLFRYKNGVWENKLVDNSISLDTITGILGTVGDTLWIGTGKAGLVRFDGTRWQSFDLKTGNRTVVYPLHYDRRTGELWCTVNNLYYTYNTFSLRLSKTYSGEGLLCFNGLTGTCYTPANSGVIDSEIRSVASDSNGLWVASAYGLAHWDRGQSSVSSLKAGDTSYKPRKRNFSVQFMENKRIGLHLDSPGFVSVSIFSLTGRLVKVINVGERNAGYNLISLSEAAKSYYVQNVYIVSVHVRSSNGPVRNDYGQVY